MYNDFWEIRQNVSISFKKWSPDCDYIVFSSIILIATEGETSHLRDQLACRGQQNRPPLSKSCSPQKNSDGNSSPPGHATLLLDALTGAFGNKGLWIVAVGLARCSSTKGSS